MLLINNFKGRVSSEHDQISIEPAPAQLIHQPQS